MAVRWKLFQCVITNPGDRLVECPEGCYGEPGEEFKDRMIGFGNVMIC